MTNPTEGAMPPLPEPAIWAYPLDEGGNPSPKEATWLGSVDKNVAELVAKGVGQSAKAMFTAEQMQAYAATLLARVAELQAVRDRLNAIVNTPQADDFLRAASTEAEHQRQRWGSEHDAGKTPADWFWLVGYLGGKALHAHAAGNVEKAEHHVITTAAALKNWHFAISGKTDMRPGIDGDAALAANKEQQP